MPKPFQYRSGSLIYFQGDAADKVFILQNGKVSLVYQDIETGEDVRDQVQAGEFFGVKSALGHYPREENAIALADSTVMVLTVPEFETLAQSNTRIIMKMLKVFSNQLRRVHKQVSSLMENKEVKPDEGLFSMGEYYLKNKRFSHAKHVFSSYLTYYPSGKNALQASKNLELAENSLVNSGSGKAAAGQSVSAAPAKVSKPDSSAISEAYYAAVSLISQEKYQEAFLAFKKIVDVNADAEWTARSSLEIGRCMFLLNKYEECIRYYTSMITKYPKHPDLKDAMFIMGQCNEKIGRKEQAAAFYKKILSMGSDDGDGTTAKVKRALGTLGV